MDFKKGIQELLNGNDAYLEEFYTHFRPTFINWMNTTYKKEASQAIDIYKYTIKIV